MGLEELACGDHGSKEFNMASRAEYWRVASDEKFGDTI